MALSEQTGEWIKFLELESDVNSIHPGGTRKQLSDRLQKFLGTIQKLIQFSKGETIYSPKQDVFIIQIKKSTQFKCKDENGTKSQERRIILGYFLKPGVMSN